MKGQEKQSPNHWILVADASRANLFESDVTLEVLTPIEAHVHPESRLPISELVTGSRGATREFSGGPQSRFERHSDPHQATVDAFARELAEVLNAGRVAHSYEHLVIVASPAFLGALRSHLSVDTARCVAGSIAHDWTSVPQHELAARIRADLAKTHPGAANT